MIGLTHSFRQKRYITPFFLWMIICLFCFAFYVPIAQAQLNFKVGGGSQFQPLPVAILDFGGDAEFGGKVSGVINANLKRSGYFVPLDPAKFPEKSVAVDAMPNFEAWRGVGVQALITGRVTKQGGSFRTEFRVWDVTSGQQMVGQQYVTDGKNWRRVAHLVSDAAYSKITGIGGFFDTRLVFVESSGPREDSRKRLAIMDSDGANVRYLTRGDEIIITPRYSPTSQEIAFMAQKIGEQPRVMTLDLETGAREVVGSFPEMTSSPRFSPNGAKLVLTVQQGGNANLYAVDLSSKATMRLTSTGAIDTSPSFSPNGAQIVFESDRGGSQQVYVMPASGGEAKRISFGEGAYAQPAWSPRGDYIAFTKQKGGRFSIGIMKPDGSGERILTEGFHNESPTWAPNGQYIMFYRDPGGQSGGKLFMVDITGRVEAAIPTPGFSADPSWSPLLGEGK
jgi:TolB protein